MKLCSECKHSEFKQKPGKLVRYCKKFKDLCLNVREKDKDCDHDGKHWDKK